MFTYKPLFKLLIEKGMKKTDLLEIMAPSTLSKLGADKYVAISVLDNICNFLDCDVEDVIRHIPEIKEAKKDEQLSEQD